MIPVIRFVSYAYTDLILDQDVLMFKFWENSNRNIYIMCLYQKGRMFENTRRELMRGIGASATGAAALGLAGNTQASTSGEPHWTVTNTVEGRNTVVTNITVGYHGSQLLERWVGIGEREEFWAHAIDVSFIAKCTADAPNILEQKSDIRFHGDTQNNEAPEAGASAWPSPPGGNWSGAFDAVLEESIGAINNVANLALAVGDIKDAYEEKSFNTGTPDNIGYETDYRSLSRVACSHSVSFEADQPPQTDGMVDILGEVNDQGFDTGAFVYLYPDHDELPSHYPADHSTSTPLMDRLDEMSEDMLERHGIEKVVNYSARDDNINTDRPTYVTQFKPNVEFDAKNGETIESSVTTN